MAAAVTGAAAATGAIAAAVTGTVSTVVGAVRRRRGDGRIGRRERLGPQPLVGVLAQRQRQRDHQYTGQGHGPDAQEPRIDADEGHRARPRAVRPSARDHPTDHPRAGQSRRTSSPSSAAAGRRDVQRGGCVSARRTHDDRAPAPSARCSPRRARPVNGCQSKVSVMTVLRPPDGAARSPKVYTLRHRTATSGSSDRHRRTTREPVAERVGFEPTDHLAMVNALAGRPIRPLRHLSREGPQCSGRRRISRPLASLDGRNGGRADKCTRLESGRPTRPGGSNPSRSAHQGFCVSRLFADVRGSG